MNYKKSKFRLIFKIISLTLIQAFLLFDFAWADGNLFKGDENYVVANETLSPSVSLNDSSLQKIFSLLPSAEKPYSDIETSLYKGIKYWRDENLREKHGRILRWIREGESLDNISRIASLKNAPVSKKIIRKIITWLYSHHPLGKIVSKGEIGDRFVVFEVPGISREGFGIKDLNDIFGYELNTQLIQLRSKILYKKMLEKDLIKGEEGHVYSTYKEDVYLIKQSLQIELPILKEILSEIRQDLINEIDQVIRQQPLYREKFKTSAGKIDKQEKIVYAINMGISGEIDQASDEARLRADINAHQAISFGSDISFTMKAYKETINKVDRLRNELMRGTSVFQQDDINKDIYFLRQEISDALRKNKQWDELSDALKLYFVDNENNFKKAQEYFSYLRLQDYIKKWQVDSSKAKERSEEIANIIKGLKGILSSNEAIDTIVLDENMIGLFNKAYYIISQEVKEPSFSSAFVFHGKAPKMKRPVAITLDIKNMGLMNLKSFEVELQLISRAIKTDNVMEVQRLWRSAADEVTIRLQKVMSFTKNILVEKLKLEFSNVVELMGGDEFTLIINEGKIEEDELARLLKYIKRYIQMEFGIGVRVGATLAINRFRVDFSDIEDMRNQLAHAKALTELDEGVERLKADEANGDQGTILIQDATGLWRTYGDSDVVPEHNYGGEDVVSRDFSGLDEDIFQGKITERIKELIEKYPDQTEPINVVIIGGGRVQDIQLEQYLNSFGENKFRLVSVAIEALGVGAFASNTVVSDMDQGLGIASGKASIVIVGDVVAPYFKDKVASLREIQRLLTEDGIAFVSDFGLLSVEDNQEESYDFKLPMLEVISRVIYKRDLSNKEVLLYAVTFGKNTPIPRLSFKRALEVTDIGDAVKYQSVYALDSLAVNELDILKVEKLAEKEITHIQEILKEKHEERAGQTLKRYRHDPRLELGRALTLKTMVESALRKVILYHNEGHVNKMLGFIDALFEFLPLRNRKLSFTLFRFAAFVHDLGYFDEKGEFVRIGHEERSKKKVLEFAKKHPGVFSSLEIRAILYMIDKTIMRIGDAVADEVRGRDNVVYKMLEKLNYGQELDDMAMLEDYVKENFPQADLSKEADRNLILDTIWGGKVLAVADLWSQAEFDKVEGRHLARESLVDWILLNEEFIYDRNRGDQTSPAAETDLGLAEAMEGFHKFFAEKQRLIYYLEDNICPDLGLQRILDLEHQKKIDKGKERESLISGRQAMLQASARLKKEGAFIRSGVDEQGNQIIDLDDLKEVKDLKDIIALVEEVAVFNPDGRRFSNILLGEIEAFMETANKSQAPETAELDLIRALEKTDIWGFLNEQEKNELLGEGIGKLLDKEKETIELFSYYNDDEILKEGELADPVAKKDGMFVLLSGKLEIYKSGYHVATLKAGSVFGEIAIIEKSPRTATVRVPLQSGKVKVARIPSSALKKLYNANSNLQHELDIIIKARKEKNKEFKAARSKSQGRVSVRPKHDMTFELIFIEQAI